MDELKGKFKALLKPAKKSSAFTGKGNRLGSDEAPKQQPARVPPPPPPRHQPSSSAGQELRPATEFSPFTAVIGGGAARTTNSMNPSNTPGDASSSTSRPLAAPAQQPQQQQPPVQQQHTAVVPTAVAEEMQHCLALVASQPGVAVSSMEVLHKLLSNLLAAPQEAKFRQLRLGPNPNPKIQAAVLEVSGALGFLKACGFEVHADQQDAVGDTFAYFLDDAKLSFVESGLSQLQLALQSAQGGASHQHSQEKQQQQQQQQQQVGSPVPPGTDQPAAAAARNASSSIQQQQPAHGPTAAAAAAAGAAAASAAAVQPAAAIAPVARSTLVLLPAAPETDVPEWFFERTAAEVKAEFMSLLRQRQAKQVFASKAWKQLQQASSSTGKQPAVITLRVRFPEGVCLQGCFGPLESVTAVFEWVTQSLRDPALTYELISPSRKPLATTGSVRQADLGGAVLNFRALGHTQHGYMLDARGRRQPFLSDAVLAQARAD